MDIMGLMKKAGAMQAKMAEMQAELDNVLVEGVSGGGLVKITLTAKGALQALSVDPSLLKADEKEIVEDLIVAAHADARRKAETVLEEKMKGMTAGLGLPPGFKLPF
jgi:DNA-binding YbaB/EbfC family protein